MLHRHPPRYNMKKFKSSCFNVIFYTFSSLLFLSTCFVFVNSQIEGEGISNEPASSQQQQEEESFSGNFGPSRPPHFNSHGNYDSTESSSASNQSPEEESQTSQIKPSSSSEAATTHFVTATRLGLPGEYGTRIQSVEEDRPPEEDSSTSTGSPEEMRAPEPGNDPPFHDGGSLDSQINSLRPPPSEEMIEDQDAVPTTNVPVDNMDYATRIQPILMDEQESAPPNIDLGVNSPFEHNNYENNNNDLEGNKDIGRADSPSLGEDEEEDAELVEEPLPTPLALISSNGEGSNPPLEEEFAEAFKRVGPNGRKRRLKSGGGRRRVRMRVRKNKQDGSGGGSNGSFMDDSSRETTTTSGYNTDEDATTPATNIGRRRYRSTTPSPQPDPSPPTIPQSVGTVSSIVRNGPKPLIISDIHSGSTGLHSIPSSEGSDSISPQPPTQHHHQRKQQVNNMEQQVEKPNAGGFTEKISTYFVTPPARISTTNVPKILESNELGLEDSKPLEQTLLGSSSTSIEVKTNRGEPWESSRSASRRGRMRSTTTMPSTMTTTESPMGIIGTLAPADAEVNPSDHIENSVQAPLMEDRAYNVNQGHGSGDIPYGNNFPPVPSTHSAPYSNSLELEQSSFDAYTGVGGGGPSESHPDHHHRNQFFPSSNPFHGVGGEAGGRFEENAPFVTNSNSDGPPGSGGGPRTHYNRNKDAFFSSNQFFKERNPFSRGPPPQGGQSMPLIQEHDHHHEENLNPTQNSPQQGQHQEQLLPVFDQHGFISTISPLEHHHDHHEQDGHEFYNNPPEQHDGNAFGYHHDNQLYPGSGVGPSSSSPGYNFKGSEPDPTIPSRLNPSSSPFTQLQRPILPSSGPSGSGPIAGPPPAAGFSYETSGPSGGYVQDGPHPSVGLGPGNNNNGAIPTSVIFAQPYTGNNPGEINQENVYPLPMSENDLHGYPTPSQQEHSPPPPPPPSSQTQQQQHHHVHQQGGSSTEHDPKDIHQFHPIQDNPVGNEQYLNSFNANLEPSKLIDANNNGNSPGGGDQGQQQSQTGGSYQNAASNPATASPTSGIGHIESSPINHQLEHNGDSEPQNFPIFIATSPGENTRSPTFGSPSHNHLNGGRPLPPPILPPQHSPHHHHGGGGRPLQSFFRNMMPSSPSNHGNHLGPYHGPGPRYPLRYPHPPNPIDHNGPNYSGSSSPFPYGPSVVGGGVGSGPPPDFQNNRNPQLNMHMPGLNNIPPPPSDHEAVNQAPQMGNFPPHTHSMSDKPDYEPANPPLPMGYQPHPLENGFGKYSPIPNDVSNLIDGNFGNFQKDPQQTNQHPHDGDHHDDHRQPHPHQIGHDDHRQPHPHQIGHDEHRQPHPHQINHDEGPPTAHHNPHHEQTPQDHPGFDVLSAYFDKPPPTVSSDFGPPPLLTSQQQNLPPSLNPHHHHSSSNNVNDNPVMSKVPFQYSSSDGGGLDSGPYFHTPGSSDSSSPPNGGKKGPKPQSSPSEHDGATTTAKPKAPPEEKNLTAMFSETPYVLMFPQLVPEEAMVPPPPKMLTKEIPVVEASSLSAIQYTPDGKPVPPLGPGLKAVAVHPRHQMYQVLAKAHYDRALQKYLDSRKKPPSAIYTPYGVLVPMGPSAAASTNHEAYSNTASVEAAFRTHHNHDDKQVLNLLLGKSNPYLGHFHLHKAASFKDGRLNKHFDFKANVDPALDLLAEKLAIKLSLAKYVLSAPAKLGVHAFTKHHATSYSEQKPTIVHAPPMTSSPPPPPPPKQQHHHQEMGRGFSSTGGSMNLGSEIKELLSAAASVTTSSSSSPSEGKLNPRSKGESVDPHLKAELKKLLKERLKEILEETIDKKDITGGRQARQQRYRNHHHEEKGRMMGMESMMSSSSHIPPPPPSIPKGGSAKNTGNTNKWINYFPMSHPSGGLLGSLKRLFSFGSSSSSKPSPQSQDRADNNNSSSSNGGGILGSNSHPFGSLSGLGMGLLGSSVGRMGQPAMDSRDPMMTSASSGSLAYHDHHRQPHPMHMNNLQQRIKSQKKVKKQLEKWLDIVLRSKDNLRNAKALAESPINNKKLNLAGGGGSSLSSFSLNGVKNGNSKKPEVKGVSTSNFLSSSWKPMVSSAFRSVFYPSGNPSKPNSIHEPLNKGIKKPL